MKEYTTPRVTILLRGASRLLAAAEEVVVSAKSGKTRIDKNGEVESESVHVTYTQDETARFLPGTILFEVTIKTPDGSVVKSETVRTTLHEAVRREVL